MVPRRLLLAAPAAVSKPPAFPSDGPVPRYARDYAAKAANGKPFRLYAQKGRILAVEILLSGCPRCQTLARVLEKIHTSHLQQPFQSVAIAADLTTPDQAAAFSQANGLTFPVLTVARPDAIRQFLELPERGHSLALPHLLLIDRQFRVRHHFHGDNAVFQNPEANLAALIAALLPERPRRRA